MRNESVEIMRDFDGGVVVRREDFVGLESLLDIVTLPGALSAEGRNPAA